MNPYENRNHVLLLRLAFLLGLSGVLAVQARAAMDVPEEGLANMPVKEVTVFKDGHVLMLHEGRVATNAEGSVVLDYLPRPVLGTFWAYSANPGAKLSAVVSGKRLVSLDRTALTVRQLVEGNVGARVRVRDESKPQVYEATILGVPERTSEELRRTSAPGTEDKLPERGDIVLLKVAEGVRAVPLGHIREVTFLDQPRSTVAHKEFRNVMTLKLDWNKAKPGKAAEVGMAYVQRGIRWIPNYRIEIDGKGEAVIRLQATLINELADIQDVKAHLVIGVPTFAFKDSVDPISLQETVAQLSSHFRQDSQTAFALSNAIMSQSAAWRAEGGRRRSGNADVMDLGPEVIGSLKNEDLYVFTVEHVTLKKGQRMVLPVAEFKLKYSDVFALDLPFGPPPELRDRFNNEQQAQLAGLFHAPKVMHKIRLQNNSDYPLTTAPALILREGRLIAQGMMTYTAVNASTDLDLTVAVDIAVEKVDKETGFTPDAEKWNGHRYGRRDLTGKIQLTNRRAETVYLEVRRSVLGHIDSASREGRIEHLDRHEGGWMITGGAPFWWNWYDWPHWWYYFNSVGRATWKFELEPGKGAELEYNWHYFWRQ